MQTISVDIPQVEGKTYEVRVGAGLLGGIGAMVKRVASAPSCCVVTDSNVATHYLAAALASLTDAGFRVISHVIPAGEEHKTLATASGAIDTLLNARVERATPVMALGGGVVGDLGGFVAAVLLRGVPFVQVPTTLLAAVDASVGGKVGVDHGAGKNLIGAFHQPRVVVTDITTFKTLPPRELRCGVAECIKHGVIRDAGLFEFIGTNAAKLLACDMAAMEELVARNVAIKVAVVHEDPFEHGVRALLNFGHTFGHAIEAVSGYSSVQHGEAVALGMVAASRMAAKLGRMPVADVERIVKLIGAVGLPVQMKGLNAEKVFAGMFTDKKVRGGKLRFVLPTKIGHAEVVNDVPEAAVHEAIASLL